MANANTTGEIIQLKDRSNRNKYDYPITLDSAVLLTGDLNTQSANTLHQYLDNLSSGIGPLARVVRINNGVTPGADGTLVMWDNSSTVPMIKPFNYLNGIGFSGSYTHTSGSWDNEQITHLWGLTDSGQIRSSAADIGGTVLGNVDDQINVPIGFQPVYVDSGDLKVTTTTVGSESKPIFMDGGVLKAGNDILYNTTGNYRSNSKKLYLTGAEQSNNSSANSYATTYTNSNVYIQNSILYASTPTSSSGSNAVATIAYVSNYLSQIDALSYKGTLPGADDTGGNSAIPISQKVFGTPAANKGDVYKVSIPNTSAYQIDGVTVRTVNINGFVVQNGDMLICNSDSTTASTSGQVNTNIQSKWDVIQSNIDIATNDAFGFVKTSDQITKNGNDQLIIGAGKVTFSNLEGYSAASGQTEAVIGLKPYVRLTYETRATLTASQIPTYPTALSDDTTVNPSFHDYSTDTN